jgi:hypothetical protein
MAEFNIFLNNRAKRKIQASLKFQLVQSGT